MKIFSLIAVLILLCVMSLSFYGCGHYMGSGNRVGTIIKLSDEGFWNKTHEIEIIRGGLNGSAGGFGVKPFYGTIQDPRVLFEAQQYYQSQTEVDVDYVERLGTVWDSECNGEDEHCAFVVGIQARGK